ncbi:MAG: YegP family protein [Niabella sp.]
MGKFVITTRTNGEFQFNLKAGNGQTILTSEGYKTKASCDNGIESVRKNSQDDGKYDRKTSSNGKFYFNLKATNGQVIGTSEMYESESGRDNGIASVKENAPGATVDDQTK